MNKLKTIISVIFIFFFIRCNGSDEPTPYNDNPKVDMTLDYRPPTPTTQAYQTFSNLQMPKRETQCCSTIQRIKHFTSISYWVIFPVIPKVVYI